MGTTGAFLPAGIVIVDVTLPVVPLAASSKTSK
jgi:hypothetical protein